MNSAMITKVMERITDENLNMLHWGNSPIPTMTCGTTMCLAGHAVVEAGYALKWYKTDNGWEADEVMGGAGTIEDIAQELLDLTDNEATTLFLETDATTVDELWEAITEITGVRRPVSAAA